MTDDQEKKLLQIGKLLQLMFPDMHGSVRFNLIPGQKDVNINIEQSIRVKTNEQRSE